MPVHLNWVDKHVELSSDFLFERSLSRVRLDRAGLAEAWVSGNSMVDRGIFDGNLVIFQRYKPDYLYDNNIVVIERIGDEQGLELGR